MCTHNWASWWMSLERVTSCGGTGQKEKHCRIPIQPLYIPGCWSSQAAAPSFSKDPSLRSCTVPPHKAQNVSHIKVQPDRQAGVPPPPHLSVFLFLIQKITGWLTIYLLQVNQILPRFNFPKKPTTVRDFFFFGDKLKQWIEIAFCANYLHRCRT